MFVAAEAKHQVEPIHGHVAKQRHAVWSSIDGEMRHASEELTAPTQDHHRATWTSQPEQTNGDQRPPLTPRVNHASVYAARPCSRTDMQAMQMCVFLLETF